MFYIMFNVFIYCFQWMNSDLLTFAFSPEPEHNQASMRINSFGPLFSVILGSEES